MLPESSFLPSHLTIEPELADQLSSRPGHQRCIEGDGELLLVTHEVPRPSVPEREALFFWKRRDGRWVGPAGTAGLVALEALLDRYAEAIDDHEEVIISANPSEIFSILRHVVPLARSSRELAEAIEQALVIDHEDKTIRALRDRVREIEHAAELLHADARISLEFQKAEGAGKQLVATERLNRLVGRIQLLLGIFLPLIILLGLRAWAPFYAVVGFCLILILALAASVWTRIKGVPTRLWPL